jgi:dihydroorotase
MKKIYHHCQLVLGKKIVRGGFSVSDAGKIVKIFKGKYPQDSHAEVIDLKGQYVLPGLIEIHGHMREPGMETKETVVTGTQAGVAGGYTALIDMPNTLPPTTTKALLEEKITSIYPGRSYMDYTFFIGVDRDRLEDLEMIDARQVAGVKLFMAGHQTTPTTVPDDKELNEVMKIAHKKKMILAIHAEDQKLVDFFKNTATKAEQAKSSCWSTHLRQPVVAIAAVARVLALAQLYPGLKVYILHTSTPEEIFLINEAKMRKLLVYSEVVSYQLTFAIDDYAKKKNFVKVSPALRTQESQNELWQIVRSQKIDVICTDHSPHERAQKKLHPSEAPAGMPGLQEAFPSLITTWVQKFGRKNLAEGLITLANMMSSTPAEIFGLTNKGGLEVGKDADFFVIDPDQTWEVRKSDLFTKVGWSAYEGNKLIGRPQATYLRGQKVYENGEVVSEPTGKRLIKKRRSSQK